MNEQLKTVYADHAAATPIDAHVLVHLQSLQASQFANPSALYTQARAARRELQNARDEVARTLGVRSQEIIFTAGATEANNLVIHGIMRKFADSHVIVSAIEHESVLEVAEQYRHDICPVDAKGTISLEELEVQITDETVLVSCMYANNEIGTVQPLKKIVALRDRIRADRQARGIDLPLYVHSDASQAANYLDCSMSRLQLDAMSVNGGKIYGPKQSGCAFIASNVQLKPLLYGGGQERGLRSGTENIAASSAFAFALKKAQNMRSQEGRRLLQLRQYFASQLNKMAVEAGVNMQINGHAKRILPNILNCTIEGLDGEWAVMQLDEFGVQAATGSACAALSDDPSHVLLAIGLNEQAANASLRFSFGRSTTQADIDHIVEAMRKMLTLVGKQ